MTTRRQVNAALKRAGINGTVERGDGYWYFAGPDFDRSYETGVYGCAYLSNMPVSRWVDEARARASNR